MRSYAVAAPVLAVLTGNWNRCRVLLLAMPVFMGANALAAAALTTRGWCSRACSRPGTLIGQTAGWRATLVFVAAIGAIALVGIAATLGPMPSSGVASACGR